MGEWYKVEAQHYLEPRDTIGKNGDSFFSGAAQCAAIFARIQAPFLSANAPNFFARFDVNWCAENFGDDWRHNWGITPWTTSLLSG